MGLAGCHQSEGECLKRQDELFQDSLKISDQIRVGWSYFFFFFNEKREKAAQRRHVYVYVMNFYMLR